VWAAVEVAINQLSMRALRVPRLPGAASGVFPLSVDALKAMAQTDVVAEELVEEANELRLLRNEIVHGRRATPITSDDLERLHALEKALRYLADRPAPAAKDPGA
jgi:hypothetical protein